MGNIHARLRPGKDDDIAEWLETRENKSTVVRQALRHHIRRQGGERDEMVQLIAQAVVGRMVRAMPKALEAAVRAALAAELDDLQESLTSAVREALGGRALRTRSHQVAEEDSEVAARIDEQLNAFFDEQ